ncbi:hypothetical protein PENTCL1PPCAC_20445, partial [Pristionchus entomophagus]
GGVQIQSGTESFDNVVCVGEEWYGMTCEGKASLLGASAAVACPIVCGTTCDSSLAVDIPGIAPTTVCHDGKEMKSCQDGNLTIQVTPQCHS